MEEYKIDRIVEEDSNHVLKIYIDIPEDYYEPIISLPLYFICDYDRARLLDLHIYDNDDRYQKLYANKPKKDIINQCFDYLERRLQEHRVLLAQVKE